MDLGSGFRPGGHRRLLALHLPRRTLAGPFGTGRLWRHKLTQPDDFSRRLLERMAIHAHTSRGTGDADRGGIRRGYFPAAPATRFGISAGTCGIVRRPG